MRSTRPSGPITSSTPASRMTPPSSRYRLHTFPVAKGLGGAWAGPGRGLGVSLTLHVEVGYLQLSPSHPTPTPSTPCCLSVCLRIMTLSRLAPMWRSGLVPASQAWLAGAPTGLCSLAQGCRAVNVFPRDPGLVCTEVSTVGERAPVGRGVPYVSCFKIFMCIHICCLIWASPGGGR